MRRRGRRWSGLALALLVALGAAGGGTRAGEARAASPRPNVLFIVTDDQRGRGTLEVMPKTLHLIADAGVRYTRAYVTTPSCCPSRSSILTGRYVHNHGVKRQNAIAALDHRSTIEYYLKQHGYFTAISGKFLNQWNLSRRPPYFDEWALFHGGYEDTFFNVDGHGSHERAYSTTVVGDEALRFLDDFQREDDARPWFLYVATSAPHAPFTPSSKYAQTPVPRFRPSDAVGENVKDKPDYIRETRAPTLAQIRAMRTGQLRTLMSVDDMVSRLFARLQAQNELQNTLVVFTSDNGMMWGDHRWMTKFVPYTNSVHVPLLLRWPGHLEPGTVRTHNVANIDLAPTVLDAVGIRPSPQIPMDGRSLLGHRRHRRLLLEYWKDPNNARRVPTWASLRGKHFQYVENYRRNGTVTFREYYDLRTDRPENHNLLHDGHPGNEPDLRPLERALHAARHCRGKSCP